MSIEPVALSRDLPAARVLRAQIGDLDLAVWRSESGILSAWENRCPHRGMRLSHGFVRGENLACLYHGWHYSSSGSCTLIPAHPEMTPPKAICTNRYQIEEQASVIWVSDTQIDTTEESTDNSLTTPSIPNNLLPVRSISCDTTAQTLFDTISSTPPAHMHLADTSAIDENPDNKLIQFNLESGECGALILLQNTDTTVAHILGGTESSTDELIQLSRWTESVRRIAESTVDVKTTEVQS